MIQVLPFSISALTQYKSFFVLDKLPKHANEVGVWITTPTGIDPVDFVNVFSLPDGTLLAAWVDPFQTIRLQNLVAHTDGHTQIINLTQLERIIDIYDRPLDSTFGTFSFGDSIPIASGDWRCYRGMYGFWQFTNDNHIDEIVTDVSEILVYESILNVNGTAHLVYVEATNKDRVANEKINNSIAPVSGRTIQETMRLIYEWFLVSQDPFNNTEKPAVAAHAFIDAMHLSGAELAILDGISNMQVANYLTGSDTARVRPETVAPLTKDIRDIVFRRMASLSLSALLKVHGIEGVDMKALLTEEHRQLNIGIQRFRDFYSVGIDVPITANARIMDCVAQSRPELKAYAHNQLRLIQNQRIVLEKVENGDI